jgi:glyoxylate/hydroxypyruvate reductase A
MTNVLLWARDPEPYRRALADAGLADRLVIVAAKPAERPSPEAMARTNVLLSINPPAGVLAEMPNLKWIQSQSVGVDHWLARPDLKPGVQLACARGTHRVAMPENILGALFHATKPILQAALDQRESRWAGRVSETLAGKTLGILGLGAIGVELARKAAALEMRVIGTKRSPSPLPHVDAVFSPEAIDEVLGQSDFVVLLLPLTPQTDNLMNAARFAAMKRSAWFINFGRGASVVDEDLIAAVRAKTIAGAILDVYRIEPLPSTHPFWTTEGITVLPHIGGFSRDRDDIVAGAFIDNVRRHLAGQPLAELVDRGRGY